MAYIKNTWVDQDVERPKTYEVTNNQDGSITLTDSFGVVTELGTPVNADNMNHIEDGIAQCYVDLSNKDLSNLSSTGEKHFLNKQQVTNCLLEVPNRVQYTFVDGSLVIKAGSVIIIPYGTTDLSSTINVGDTFIHSNLKVYDTYWDSTNSKFYVYAQLQDDHIRGTSAGSSTITTRHIAFSIADDSLGTVAYGNAISSTSDTVSPSTCLFYNTTSNLVKKKDSGVIGTQVCSLPFGLVVNNDTYQVAEVKQVFNGFGYIGSIIWADKGIKGLIPNGRNADGSLNNIEYTTENITVNTSPDDGFLLLSISTEPPYMYLNGTGRLYYNAGQNYNYYNGAREIRRRIIVGCVNFESGVITSFTVQNALNINSMCDGQWVNSRLTLASGATYPTTNDTIYDISSYLPNDGYNYEVWLTGYVTTGATSGNYLNLNIYTDALMSFVRVCAAQTRTNATVVSAGSAVVPVSTARIIKVFPYSSYKGTYDLNLVAYRRLGTNV